MALEDDLKKRMKEIFGVKWDTHKGRVVPAPNDIAMANAAVEFDKATVLYADLSGSTALVDTKLWTFAAEVYKSYLYCAARIVNVENGWITSYDGDRIMGIFLGDDQCTRAMRAALKINHAVKNIVNPAIKVAYTTDYQVSQVVGIDTSSIRAARTGARGDSDLVWVGRAANYAAKLTNLKGDERTWITREVYDGAGNDIKIWGGKAIWKSYTWTLQGNHSVYGSAWTWVL